MTANKQDSQQTALSKFCINLTSRARENKLDPVIGREEEIRRVLQILSRRTKNNPVLVGDPGVGKTAIVEGIAQRIISNDVPESLKNKEVFSLDLGLLIAGAKYQGEFEERLKGLLKEVASDGDGKILFIDELHMLVGAGSSGGGMDASNLLKPALARGELHCIGATTTAEYKKFIEQDAALERRFQKVSVEEPSPEDALSILRGLKEKYELHHGIKIKDNALVQAVQLSARMIPDRFLPDKAIDLIDEAASLVKMSLESKPEEIDFLERKIRQHEIEMVALSKEKDATSIKQKENTEKELLLIKQKHEELTSQWKKERAPIEKMHKLKEQIDKAKTAYAQAEREGDYNKASRIKYGELTELSKQLEQTEAELSTMTGRFAKDAVDAQDIATVVSRWTKIPVQKLTESEGQKLLNMETVLHDRVIGQDDAISKVCNTIRIHRSGLADPKKPVGTFLFLGPTGVGKTEVARTLADYLFNDEHKLIRIDMSEFMEKHAVARLIGAPPGYIGYEQGGQLTEAVRKNPYSIILFDEIEKAHPDVFNIFLQIFDEGRLTDSQGRTVSFKNCIIIMTSNIGSDKILSAHGGINVELRQQLDALLHAHFRPELLNRIDEIVYFTALSNTNIERIFDTQLKSLLERLAEKQITLSVSPEAKTMICDLGYIPEFGARPLKRAIQEYIVQPLSKELLSNPEKHSFSCTKNGDLVVIKPIE
ncbi:AAA family ATPase [Candidatus Dependentiae bacterium]|nr:AAA family ATPase [Candidatus Dependentiae bacterium]